MYCSNCGQELTVENVCPGCQIGDNQKNTYQDNYNYQAYGYTQAIELPNRFTASIARKMRTSAGIWIFIAIFQILIGIPLMIFGYGFLMILCGIWNIYASSTNRKLARQIDYCDNPQSGSLIVHSFEVSLSLNIVFLFLNLFFGGAIGVIGNLYHLVIRNEVLANKNKFGVN